MKHVIKAVLLVSALIAVAACNKNKESADVAALAKQLSEMQAKLEAAEKANAAPEEVAKLEAAVAEIAKQEQAAQSAVAEQKQEAAKTTAGTTPAATTATPAASTATTSAPAVGKIGESLTTPTTAPAAPATTPAASTTTSSGGFQMSGTTLTKYTGSGGNVIIPNNVTSIGEGAFFNNKNITSVNIPDSVTKIEFRAFSGSGLTSVTIGNGVTSLADTEAFRDCSRLTSVTIGSGLKDIGDAFWDCTSLASITVDANNPNYSSVDGILYNKAKTEFVLVPRDKTGNVTIPNSVTSIKENAFATTKIASVTIPNSVTSIKKNAFWNCNNLTTVTFQGAIAEANLDTQVFGFSVANGRIVNFDLIPKYLAGGPGTYIKAGKDMRGFETVWEKQ